MFEFISIIPTSDRHFEIIFQKVTDWITNNLKIELPLVHLWCAHTHTSSRYAENGFKSIVFYIIGSFFNRMIFMFPLKACGWYSKFLGIPGLWEPSWFMTNKAFQMKRSLYSQLNAWMYLLLHKTIYRKWTPIYNFRSSYQSDVCFSYRPNVKLHKCQNWLFHTTKTIAWCLFETRENVWRTLTKRLVLNFSVLACECIRCFNRSHPQITIGKSEACTIQMKCTNEVFILILV